MDEDLFDDLLNLEDNYYQDGYRLGVEDGSRAGRIEGRTFGLEKGFEKFFDLGRLHGKSEILGARLPSQTSKSLELSGEHEKELQENTSNPQASVIKMLPDNERLAKHIRTLFALTELESLSTENNEDAVSEFDDRLKRAVAKAKVIENIIGERPMNETVPQASETKPNMVLSRASGSEKNIEDFGVQIS